MHQSLIMSGLPDSDSRAVCLYLIDVTTSDPDWLALHDRLLNDSRLLNDDRLGHNCGLLNHDRLGHNCRRGLNHNRLGVVRIHQRRPDYTTGHPTDESRPEVSAARSPVAAVVMMVASMPAVMVISSMPAVMVISTVPAVRERTG